MTLSPAAQPNLSTLRSPAGFNAACSSMLSERAPTPPRFIGHSTWISRMGSRPKRRGMRVFTNSIMRGTAASGSFVSTALRLVQSGKGALVDPVRVHDDLALGRLTEHLGQAHHRAWPHSRIMSAWPGPTEGN